MLSWRNLILNRDLILLCIVGYDPDFYVFIIVVCLSKRSITHVRLTPMHNAYVIKFLSTIHHLFNQKEVLPSYHAFG